MQLLSSAFESEEMALAVDHSNGVVIVPAFTGLGAPYWDMEARGIITGLTRGSNRNHIVRAALESIAFQVNDLLDAVSSDLDFSIPSLQVDGGATANNFLMQFQSDILQMKIYRPKNIESTALGAGMLAGIGSGFWSNFNQLTIAGATDIVFKPSMGTKTRTDLLRAWKQSVQQSIYT